MGGYSKGCFHCRRRKIKCDEQRPTCAHCVRRGDTCRYPDPTRVAFRSMNNKIVARYGHAGAPLPGQPSIDWEEQARMHFFHHYVVVPAAYRRGYLEFLPELLEQNPSHPALKHAFAAVSLAQLANMQNLADLATQAQSHYGLALREIARAMTDPGTASTDCGLTSIVLLQKYEILCGLKTSPSDAHDVGLTHLIASRRRESAKPAGDHSLSFIIDGRRHMNTIDGAKDPGGDEPKVSGITPAGQQLWGLIALAASLSGKMRQMMVSGRAVADRTAVARLWSEAVTALRRLRKWPQHAPAQVEYKEVALQLPHLTKVYTYNHVQNGVMWIGLWSSQIRFAQMMLAFGKTFNLLDQIRPYVIHATSSELRAAAMDAVEGICASSSYMVGEVDKAGQRTSETETPAVGSYFLVRGLNVASEVEGISEDQCMLLLDKLWQIGHQKGIKQALRAHKRRMIQLGMEG